MRVALSILFTLALASAVPIPPFMTLNAPYTPFLPDKSVNLTAVAALAADAAASGCTAIWVGGGMGQFDALSITERQDLFKVWASEGHKHGLFVLAHVGTTVQSDAIKMAQYAASVGVDAIASVPPYYERPGTVQALIDWFAPVTAAAPGLPFFYYHIPGSTGVYLSMYDFVTAAKTQLPALKGIKYVESNQLDFLNLVQDYNKDYVLMWAPEPKIQSLPYAGYGSVLAESFYAGTYLRMWNKFNAGDMAGARAEQEWKYSVENVFGKYGDNAKRWVYRTLCNVDMGLPRVPGDQVPISDSDYANLVADLNAVGFFNQTIPAWTPPKN